MVKSLQEMNLNPSTLKGKMTKTVTGMLETARVRITRCLSYAPDLLIGLFR